jgi:hypothetical protein
VHGSLWCMPAVLALHVSGAGTIYAGAIYAGAIYAACSVSGNITNRTKQTIRTTILHSVSTLTCSSAGDDCCSLPNGRNRLYQTSVSELTVNPGILLV